MKKNNLLWVAIGGLLAAVAVFFVTRKKEEGLHMKPPKGAPQLDLDNPGDQSEFPSSPSDSELG